MWQKQEKPKKKNARNRVEIGRFVYIFVYLICKSLIFKVYCGERGIRTPGTFQYVGFQDRCNRPLCHLSNFKCQRNVVLSFWRCKSISIFWTSQAFSIFFFKKNASSAFLAPKTAVLYHYLRCKTVNKEGCHQKNKKSQRCFYKKSRQHQTVIISVATP